MNEWMNEYFISQCRTSKSRIRYEYKNCRQATRAEKPAATFSVLGLSHVMRYISVRYLLTYLLTYLLKLLLQPRCHRGLTAAPLPSVEREWHGSCAVVAGQLHSSCNCCIRDNSILCIRYLHTLGLSSCKVWQSINQSINQYSYSSGMTKRRSTGYNNITNYTKH